MAKRANSKNADLVVDEGPPWNPTDIGDVSVERLIEAAKREGRFVYDLETTGLDPRRDRIEGVAFYVPNEKDPTKPGLRAWFPFVDGSMDYTVGAAIQRLRPAMPHLETMEKLRELWLIPELIAIAHNGVFDMGMLKCASGCTTPIRVENCIADSMLGDYMQDERARRYGLKIRVDQVFKHRMTTYEEASGKQGVFGFARKKPLGAYAMDDCQWTYRLWKWAMESIRRQDPPRQHQSKTDTWRSPIDPDVEPGFYSDLEKIYWNIEMNVQRVILEMETQGCLIDWEWLVEVQRSLESQKLDILEKIKRDAGWAPNLRSPKQVSDFLYGTKEEGGLGLPTDGLDFNEDLEQYTTADKVIAHFGKKEPIVKLLLDYRSLEVIDRSFCQKLIKIAQEQGRCHSHFNQTGTVIGRLSCVAGDTVLETTAGSTRISDLDLSDGKNYTIETHRGQFCRITQQIYKGLDAMYEVRLDGGQSIKCTQDHRFLTVDGWKRLGDIHSGARLVVPTDVREARHSYEGRKADGPGRSLVRQDLSYGAVDPDRGHGEVRDLVSDAHRLSADLLTEVRRSVAAQAGCESLQGHEGPQARTWAVQEGLQPRDPVDPAEGFASRVGRTGSEGYADREVARHDGAPCSSEYRASRDCQVSRNADVLAETWPGGVGAAGGFGSRIQGGREVGLCRSADVLPQALPRLCASAVPVGGSSILFQEPGLPPEDRQGREGPRLVLDERRGAPPLDGVAGSGDTAPASALRIQELERGLRVSSGHADGRGGWSLSRDLQGDEAAGQAEASEVRVAWLSDSPVHDEGGQGGDWPRRIGDRVFATAKVVSIVAIGVDHVWDISVEGDESYLAHGFVNHNSANPINLMNQPRDKNLIRKAFCSRLPNEFDPERMDMVFLDADYGQVELRMAAHLAQEKGMLDVYRAGTVCKSIGGEACDYFKYAHGCKDKKKLKCKWIGLIKPDGVIITPEGVGGPKACPKCGSEVAWLNRCRHTDLHQRTSEDVGVDRNPLAKNLNFGLLYRMGAPKFVTYADLYDEDGSPRIEYAEELVEKWHAAYPGIAHWHDRVIDALIKNNYIAYTLTRRRRRLDVEFKRNDFRAGTQAIQFMVSGSCQDIMKLAMVKIYNARNAKIANTGPAERKQWARFRFMVQVHDEVIMEGPKSIEPEMAAMVKTNMEGVAPNLSVPLVADVRTGRNWDETH